MAMAVRDLRIDDYGAMRSFWESSRFPVRDPGPEARDQVARRLALPTVRMLGLFDGGALRGTAVLGFDGMDAWVRSLFVAPEARAAGGVSDLLGAAAARAGVDWGAGRVLVLFARPNGDLWDRCLAAGAAPIHGRAMVAVQTAEAARESAGGGRHPPA